MAWLYKRGDKWWIGWRLGKNQFLKPTGETDRTKAKTQLEAVERLEVARRTNALTEDFYRAATGRTVQKSTLADFCAAWLAESEGVTTKTTVSKYRQVVKEFCGSVQAEATGLLIEDVTVDHVAAFLTAKRKKLAPGTVKVYRRILSSIFLLAQNQGKIRGNPVALAKGRGKASEDATTKKRPFTLKELGTLYSAASPFWQYMIQAGYFSGQSLGDLVTMRAETVDLAQNQITMNRRKTGKQVIIPLSKTLRALLVSIWPKGGKGCFWPKEAERYEKSGSSSFSQEFYELMASVGLVAARSSDKLAKGTGRAAKRVPQKLGFHNLRHTFVTHLKIGGAMDSVAKELAGHSSNAISAVYTHLPAESLSRAINQLPEFVK